MLISTKLDGPAAPDRGSGRAGVLMVGHASERVTALATRAYGLAVAAVELVSNAFVEAWGELRSRMDAARGAAGRGRRMRIVESLALGGRRQLLLVRCDEQEYLVGTGPDSVETIVLRQTAAAAEVGGTPSAGTGQAGTGQAGAGRAGAGQAGRTQAAQKTRLAGAALTRPGAMDRDRRANGPWLVTAPALNAIARNRIREAEIGQGRTLWT